MMVNIQQKWRNWRDAASLERFVSQDAQLSPIKARDNCLGGIVKIEGAFKANDPRAKNPRPTEPDVGKNELLNGLLESAGIASRNGTKTYGTLITASGYVVAPRNIVSSMDLNHSQVHLPDGTVSRTLKICIESKQKPVNGVYHGGNLVLLKARTGGKRTSVEYAINSSGSLDSNRVHVPRDVEGDFNYSGKKLASQGPGRVTMDGIPFTLGKFGVRVDQTEEDLCVGGPVIDSEGKILGILTLDLGNKAEYTRISEVHKMLSVYAKSLRSR